MVYKDSACFRRGRPLHSQLVSPRRRDGRETAADRRRADGLFFPLRARRTERATACVSCRVQGRAADLILSAHSIDNSSRGIRRPMRLDVYGHLWARDRVGPRKSGRVNSKDAGHEISFLVTFAKAH